jgi:hypothetical protein
MQLVLALDTSLVESLYVVKRCTAQCDVSAILNIFAASVLFSFKWYSVDSKGIESRGSKWPPDGWLPKTQFRITLSEVCKSLLSSCLANLRFQFVLLSYLKAKFMAVVCNTPLILQHTFHHTSETCLPNATGCGQDHFPYLQLRF